MFAVILRHAIFRKRKTATCCGGSSVNDCEITAVLDL